MLTENIREFRKLFKETQPTIECMQIEKGYRTNLIFRTPDLVYRQSFIVGVEEVHQNVKCAV